MPSQAPEQTLISTVRTRRRRDPKLTAIQPAQKEPRQARVPPPPCEVGNIQRPPACPPACLQLCRILVTRVQLPMAQELRYSTNPRSVQPYVPHDGQVLVHLLAHTLPAVAWLRRHRSFQRCQPCFQHSVARLQLLVERQ